MSYDFISIKKANDSKHKYVATFKNKTTGREKNTKFGAAGMQDFTTHDPKERDERKRLYRIRHAGDGGGGEARPEDRRPARDEALCGE